MHINLLWRKRAGFFSLLYSFYQSPFHPLGRSFFRASTPWHTSTACGSHCMCVLSPLVSYGLPWPCDSLGWRVTHTYPREIWASCPAKSNNPLYIADVQPNIFGIIRHGCFIFFFTFICTNLTQVPNTQSLNSQHHLLKYWEFILFLYVQTATIHF